MSLPDALSKIEYDIIGSFLLKIYKSSISDCKFSTINGVSDTLSNEVIPKCTFGKFNVTLQSLGFSPASSNKPSTTSANSSKSIISLMALLYLIFPEEYFTTDLDALSIQTSSIKLFADNEIPTCVLFLNPSFSNIFLN